MNRPSALSPISWLADGLCCTSLGSSRRATGFFPAKPTWKTCSSPKSGTGIRSHHVLADHMVCNFLLAAFEDVVGVLRRHRIDGVRGGQHVGCQVVHHPDQYPP